MPAFLSNIAISLLASMALAHPGSPNRLIQRQATTVTVTVTSVLTTCPASTVKPSTATTATTTAITTKPSTTGIAATTSLTTTSAATATGVTQQGSLYNVAGAGLFQNAAVYDFSTASSLPSGLYASDYTVQDTDSGAPYNHQFVPTNAKVGNGFLNLIVPGVTSISRGGTIKCAEVATTQSNILYASVRTYAILSNVPGTCQSAFFYHDDTQETDIEYLSDSTSQSNNGPGSPIPVWFSNQATVVGQDATQQSVVPMTNGSPANLSTSVHEWRTDWTPSYTAHYFDGQLQAKLTSNVPSVPGSWIWNNWSNGDKGWSVGPPKSDNTYKIQKIVMYYNTTSN